ncbi:MAG: hypothetical protein GEU92_21235 [Alphaproteobacteria bacterium]|nr:hypothetical protein [Alphaproteobacteria bacterium]
MVVSGGMNVYPEELEAVLRDLPEVAAAAVVGVPDDRYGEALFAVIVPRPGTALTEEEVVAHCRGRIGGYKIPRRMAFVDELPKNPTGKVERGRLRTLAAGRDAR